MINLGDKLWSVHNYEGSYLGSIDLQDATIYSDNSVYAQLTAQVGPKNVADTAHELGVTRPLEDYFAIGLGVEAVSPLEMARAFATLANGGERIDGSVLGNVPRAVLRVEDGRRADANDPVKKHAVGANDAALVNVDSPAGRHRGDRPARRAGRSVRGRQDRGRRTTATRGSSAIPRSSPSPSGSATRTGSSPWRPSSKATRSPAAHSRR